MVHFGDNTAWMTDLRYQIFLRFIWDWDKLEISFTLLVYVSYCAGEKLFMLRTGTELQSNIWANKDDQYVSVLRWDCEHSSTIIEMLRSVKNADSNNVCSFAHDTCNFVSAWIDSTCANKKNCSILLIIFNRVISLWSLNFFRHNITQIKFKCVHGMLSFIQRWVRRRQQEEARTHRMDKNEGAPALIFPIIKSWRWTWKK